MVSNNFCGAKIKKGGEGRWGNLIFDFRFLILDFLLKTSRKPNTQNRKSHFGAKKNPRLHAGGKKRILQFFNQNLHIKDNFNNCAKN
jgi:hypothetical protein